MPEPIHVQIPLPSTMIGEEVGRILCGRTLRFPFTDEQHSRITDAIVRAVTAGVRRGAAEVAAACVENDVDVQLEFVDREPDPTTRTP